MIKKLRLYHYSSKDFKGYINPDYFGENTYTQNSVYQSEIARSFFYIGRGREYYLSGVKFCYIAEIEPEKIYDLDKDIKGFKDNLCFNDILLKIKNLGYYGVAGNNGFKVVCLFKRIKYIDKRTLTKGY